MRKISNKGFMLAEVIVTSTIVMTAMIGLYYSFNKLYNRYKTLETYENIDGMYAIDSFLESSINELDPNASTNINNLLASIEASPNKYMAIIDNNPGCNLDPGTELSETCLNIKNAYSIQYLYIIKRSEIVEEKGANKIVNYRIKNLNQQNRETFYDYLKYIYNCYDNVNNYLIIMEYKNDNKYYYSSLELKSI